MADKFNTILSIVLIPQIIELIINNDNYSDIAATEVFYRSKTYELLNDEQTKLWHYSPLTIYNIWKTEMESGEIVFPEET